MTYYMLHALLPFGFSVHCSRFKLIKQAFLSKKQLSSQAYIQNKVDPTITFTMHFSSYSLSGWQE